MRATYGLPSLRDARIFAGIRRAFASSSSADFRLLHFSVQADHVHVLVEAESTWLLRSGIQGLAIRIAKAVNRLLGRRGSVWGDRYHARMLATPREVRNALVYVLGNVKKHVRGASGIDPRSSASWFEGWRRTVGTSEKPSPVARARTWLARVGWRRHGLIDVEEGPRPG